MKSPSGYTTQLVGNHLTIERVDGQPIRWAWDRIQAIKNQVAGPDVQAVEFYPAVGDVVNEVNRRHLWLISPEDLPPPLRRDRGHAMG